MILPVGLKKKRLLLEYLHIIAHLQRRIWELFHPVEKGLYSFYSIGQLLKQSVNLWRWRWQEEHKEGQIHCRTREGGMEAPRRVLHPLDSPLSSLFTEERKKRSRGEWRENLKMFSSIPWASEELLSPNTSLSVVKTKKNLPPLHPTIPFPLLRLCPGEEG